MSPYEKRQARIAEVKAHLLRQHGSGMTNPKFCARDLGFADHTAIQPAVCEIVAQYAAQCVAYYEGIGS